MTSHRVPPLCVCFVFAPGICSSFSRVFRAITSLSKLFADKNILRTKHGPKAHSCTRKTIKHDKERKKTFIFSRSLSPLPRLRTISNLNPPLPVQDFRLKTPAPFVPLHATSCRFRPHPSTKNPRKTTFVHLKYFPSRMSDRHFAGKKHNLSFSLFPSQTRSSEFAGNWLSISLDSLCSTSSNH